MLFVRNPNLAKVTLASGLLLAAVDIAPAFDMGPDPYDAWRKEGGGAYHMALFSFGESAWALLTAPFFIYLTDKVDRRVGFLILAMFSCVPTWVYWFVDVNEMKAAWANSIATIFAATGTTTNIAFVLATDVTPFKDRELMSGGYYGLKHFVAMSLAPLPCLVLIVFNSFGMRDPLLHHPRVILIYQLVLTGLFVLVVLTIRPEKRGSEDEKNPGDSSLTDDTVSEDAERDNSVVLFTPWQMLCAGIEMLKLMWSDYRLFRLSVAGFILSFSRTAALGNNGQYYYQVLKLETSHGKYVDVNVLRNFAGHLAVLPGFVLTGYFAMKTGALKTLRRLVLLAAVMLAGGVAMEAVDSIWFTIVVEFMLSMTDLYDGPLNRIVAGVARPGRVGAWLNMFGVAVEVGIMLGNLTIVCFNFTYWRTRGIEIPVWPYYPLCGLVVLFALWPLWTDHPGPKGSKVGWGAAAGLPREVLHSTLGAMKAARTWRKKTITNRSPPIVLDDEALSEDPSEEQPGLLATIARRVSGSLLRNFSLHMPSISRHGSPSSSSSDPDSSEDDSIFNVAPRPLCRHVSDPGAYHSEDDSPDSDSGFSDSEDEGRDSRGLKGLPRRANSERINRVAPARTG